LDRSLDKKKILCTICARGGSKGVPGKNIRELAGLPLLAHSILQAKQSGIFDSIAVSSDSSKILAVAAKYGADFLIERPPELSTDAAPKVPVIQHCFLTAERLAGTQFDIGVDLDATSPLRVPADIIAATETLVSSDAQNVITGSPSRRSPYFNLVEANDVGYVTTSKTLPRPCTRRQDAPKTYDMNASIYVWRRSSLINNSNLFLEKTVLYEMPEERSIDIDSELDFKIVEMLMKERY